MLTPQEVETLFSIIGKMAESGISVLLITHKLNEVMHISQRVTVLRRGKMIATIDTAETTRSSLAKLLVGREFDFVVHKEQVQPGPPTLEIKGLSAVRDNGSQALQGISLDRPPGRDPGPGGRQRQRAAGAVRCAGRCAQAHRRRSPAGWPVDREPLAS